jgi:hypothetical protein
MQNLTPSRQAAKQFTAGFATLRLCVILSSDTAPLAPVSTGLAREAKEGIVGSILGPTGSREV